MSLSYRDAGVDIDAGNALVERIKPLARATRRLGSDSSIGGFGALFDLKALNYRDPILVSTTDGVGTKLKIAFAMDEHNSIGIDLVAMCVNDLLAQGAEPLFFLDYFATSALDVDTAADVIAGIAEGCRQSHTALIGGETAEMPGMYSKGHYDLAGFTVGVVERDQVLPKLDQITPGDAVIGLASSGVHSNGFSLVNRVMQDAKLDFRDAAPFALEQSFGDCLLTPTRLYVQSMLPLIKKNTFKAIAHITGGGLVENPPRVLPRNVKLELDLSHWALPPVFQWLHKTGNIDAHEMLRTFNCGIGMIAIVSQEKAEQCCKELRNAGEAAWIIGHVSERSADEESVIFHALEKAFPHAG